MSVLQTVLDKFKGKKPEDTTTGPPPVDTVASRTKSQGLYPQANVNTAEDEIKKVIAERKKQMAEMDKAGK